MRDSLGGTVDLDDIEQRIAVVSSDELVQRLPKLLLAWAQHENVLTSHDEAVLNTNQAAAMTGYSRAQLLHLYKQGRLRGHKNGKHVVFRAGDLPKKPRGGNHVVLEAGSTPVPDGERRASARRLAERLGVREYASTTAH